jgi:hypothetical protein
MRFNDDAEYGHILEMENARLDRLPTPNHIYADDRTPTPDHHFSKDCAYKSQKVEILATENLGNLHPKSPNPHLDSSTTKALALPLNCHISWANARHEYEMLSAKNSASRLWGGQPRLRHQGFPDESSFPL